MDGRQIAHRRMHNLRLAGAPFEGAEEVVRWLGAVQSQDYGPANWSIGQRSNGIGDVAIDQAFADGAILRTHVLRPTWHCNGGLLAQAPIRSHARPVGASNGPSPAGRQVTFKGTKPVKHGVRPPS